MKPCLVFVGNQDWYNWYQEEVTELVNWAQSQKIRVCTRERIDGYTETGFFTLNPIKQFKLGLRYAKSGVNDGRIDHIHFTPTLTEKHILESYEDLPGDLNVTI